MIINEQTAQLILDAIAWCNKDWFEVNEWETNCEELVNTSRADFIRFCKERGIEGVERKVTIREDR